ncbi:MAG: hypothetical protein AAFP90_22425, partial [Planctomycetota bacterium]
MDVDPVDVGQGFFTWMTMEIPSNDAFLAVPDLPLSDPIFDPAGNFLGPLLIQRTGLDVLDAGTEVNTEMDAAFLNQAAPDAGLVEGLPVQPHVGFNGSVGNPGGAPVNILGGTTAAGTIVDPVDGDFTADNDPLMDITIDLVTSGNDFITADVDDTVDGGGGSDSIAIGGDAGDDTFRVFRDGTDLVIEANGREVSRLPFASANALAIHGNGGNDTLTADFTGGAIVPSGGFTFNGGQSAGAPGDSLNILGSFTNQILNYTPPGVDGNNGNVVLDGETITYTGLEPILAGNAVNTTLNLPAGLSNDATLQNSVAAGQIEIIDNGATFEDTVIPNPTNSLTVNLGDNNDTLTINTLDAAYAASLIINGGAGAMDTVNMNNVSLFNTPGRGLLLTGTETFAMNGGTISGNTADSGAGIRIENSLVANTVANITG